MTMRILLAAILLFAALPAAATERLHGADSSFTAPGISVGWAVLRHREESEVKVVLRLRATGDRFTHVRAEGVDPFTRERAELVPATSIGAAVDLAIPRARFATLPSLELHLDRSAEAVRGPAPAVTIFYLGVPDTTPEFDAAPALDAYLAKAVGAR